MDARTVWITGAGTGMGRAAALAAAREGRPLALSGRRPEVLEEVAEEVRALGGTALAVPLDVTDRLAVRSAAAQIEEELGGVEALVLSAGLNAPRRYWRDQDLDEFAAITETNLLGPVSVIDAALPGMRARGEGTIVVISSYSAWRFSRMPAPPTARPRRRSARWSRRSTPRRTVTESAPATCAPGTSTATSSTAGPRCRGHRNGRPC